MGNQAVLINPPTGASIHLTTHGSDWLWAVFSLFVFGGLLHLSLGYKLRPPNERLFFYSSTAALFFMSIMYFTWASDLGFTTIETEFNHADQSLSGAASVRQIFYAKWVGYFLAGPCVIANVAILSAASWPTVLFTIVCQETFVVTFLIGSLIHSSYKWGYFTFGVVAYLIVAYQLLFGFRRSSSLPGRLATGLFGHSGAIVFIWMLYPIAWGLSEGGNVIQPDSEAVFYGVLDICQFIVIGTHFQWLVRNLDFADAGLLVGSGAFLHEKNHHSFETDRNAPFVNNAGAGPSVAAPVVAHQGVTDHNAVPYDNTAAPYNNTAVAPGMTTTNATTAEPVAQV